MEEDIKILEEIVDIYYDCAGNKEQDYDMRVDMGFMKKETQAIENLIKGYRELEQCLEVTSKSLNNVAYDQIPIAIQDLIVSSIPKSKIKEKIEELNKIILNARDGESDFILHCCTKKQALEELMEDK